VGVDLIRRNNREQITAYQDSVLFHYATHGDSGVIAGVGSEFELTNTADGKVKISTGMGCIYGRQFEIRLENELVFDWSALGQRYITIYAEIDLRDPTNETAQIKAQYSQSGFPTIPTGDNLISTPEGIANYEMYRVQTRQNGTAASITKQFKLLKANRTQYADNADYATNANQSVHARDINNVVLTHKGTDGRIIGAQYFVRSNEYEMFSFCGKQNLYDSISSFYSDDSVGHTLLFNKNMTGRISQQSLLEIIYSVRLTLDGNVKSGSGLQVAVVSAGTGDLIKIASVVRLADDAQDMGFVSADFSLADNGITYKGGVCSKFNLPNGGDFSRPIGHYLTIRQINLIHGGLADMRDWITQ
jgi:hypothetical protein